ncbi:DUF934 domain-containing protein [Pelagibaculum spongiae]|uniref:Oxidoreductase n=1 Tax=Pelagibaculum spongiae TaxID=2080658 RepID=A0A2V1GWX6_9GAMM|nr:DUF934 domain-containing protein [Pelagibaculum spongiae]PVZ69568.1 hypothetical protein DC094_09630 [Pelagibaculum spongiae]
MATIRNRVISDELWLNAADEPESDPTNAASKTYRYLLLEQWQQQSAEQQAQLVPLLPGDIDPAEHLQQLLPLAAIAIEFPSFADGRGYSIATLLRERYSYSGDLIAVGDILQDQAAMLTRCGFNVLVLRHDQPVEAVLKKIGQYAVNYQPEGERPPLWRKRLQS